MQLQRGEWGAPDLGCMLQYVLDSQKRKEHQSVDIVFAITRYRRRLRNAEKWELR